MTKSVGAMTIEPVEVQYVKLRRRLLGYDPRDVDDLLEDVTSSYEEVWLERDALRALAERQAVEIEHHRKRERLVGDILLGARKVADETVAEARETAEVLLRKAHKRVDKIERDARREPERLRAEVRRLTAIERSLRERYQAFLSGAQRLLEDGASPAKRDAPLGSLRLSEDGQEAEAPRPGNGKRQSPAGTAG